MDFVCGGAGDDRVSGGPNPFTYNHPRRGDRLSGGNGNDRVIDGGEGYRDLLLGGSGDDRVITVRTGGESRTLKGGPGADRLTSSGYYEVILGGPGSDELTSEGYYPFLAGGAGTDVLTLEGSGDNVLSLDADGDQVRIRRALYIVLLTGPEPVEVDLAAGFVRRIGAVTGDVLTLRSRPRNPSYFVVYGTDGDDRISGREFSEQMYGRSGDDVLDGRGGDDVLDGGPGKDTCIDAGEVSVC